MEIPQLVLFADIIMVSMVVHATFIVLKILHVELLVLVA